jgi:hypothetical protein
VKSVVEDIPTYCMSTILLPQFIGKESHGMINSFWWGQVNLQAKLLSGRDTCLSTSLNVLYLGTHTNFSKN